jgi:hypothetical protein
MYVWIISCVNAMQKFFAGYMFEYYQNSREF